MSAPGDFIIVNRSILSWEWYSDPPVRMLFFHILLSCRYLPGRWQGMDIEPGQLPTSLPALATGTGLSMQQVRTALKKLESTGEISDQSSNAFRLITVMNWVKWQGSKDAKATGKQQASNRQATGKQQASNSTIRREEGKKGRREEPDPNGSVANGQLPIEGMPVAEAPPPPVTPRGPDPSVQSVVEYLEAKVIENEIAKSLDSPQAKHRQYAHLLLRKAAKDYPNFDPVETVKRLIDYAVTDPKNASRCTKMSHLFYNFGTLVAEAKAKKSNPKTQTDADRKLALAERLAAYARESAGDVQGR